MRKPWRIRNGGFIDGELEDKIHFDLFSEISLDLSSIKTPSIYASTGYKILI